MKKILVGLGLLLTAPFVLVAATGPTVGCTYTATPTAIPLGVPTKVKLHYTSTNANWFIGTLFGGGIAAYSTSGDQYVTISKASRYEMTAIDLASGNAHYCVASVSTRSRTQPN